MARRISLKLSVGLAVILMFLMVILMGQNSRPPLKIEEKTSEDNIKVRVKENKVKEQLEKLPKPKDIIKAAIGPVKKKKAAKMTVLERFSLLLESLKCSSQVPNKNLLILVGHPGSGLDKFAEALHKKHGVFVIHEDDKRVLMSAKEIIYTLTNLSRCAIINRSDVIHEILEESPLKFNSFIIDSCDDKCLTSPSLWTQLCQFFQAQALSSHSLDLNVLNDVLRSRDVSVDVIYVIRDPRAMLHAKMSSHPGLKLGQEADALCESLFKDFKIIDSKIPKFNFYTLRYEEFATKPDEQISSYLKGFHGLANFCQKENPMPANKISPDSVDSWKQALSMDDIVTIEDKCTQILNRLEYPIYGSNFAA